MEFWDYWLTDQLFSECLLQRFLWSHPGQAGYLPWICRHNPGELIHDTAVSQSLHNMAEKFIHRENNNSLNLVKLSYFHLKLHTISTTLPKLFYSKFQMKSLIYIHYSNCDWQINGKDNIDLPEGARPEMYDITPTAPPYVLCRDLGLSAPENCTITLNARTPLDSNELKCPGGKEIKQMAVSMYLKVYRNQGG